MSKNVELSKLTLKEIRTVMDRKSMGFGGQKPSELAAKRIAYRNEFDKRIKDNPKEYEGYKYQQKLENVKFNLKVMRIYLEKCKFDENDQSEIIKDMDNIVMLSNKLKQRLIELKKH